jgi:hypothetical protein
VSNACQAVEIKTPILAMEVDVSWWSQWHCAPASDIGRGGFPINEASNEKTISPTNLPLTRFVRDIAASRGEFAEYACGEAGGVVDRRLARINIMVQQSAEGARSEFAMQLQRHSFTVQPA